MNLRAEDNGSPVACSAAVKAQSRKGEPSVQPAWNLLPSTTDRPAGGAAGVWGIWVWMFRDMITNDDLTADERRTWTFLFVLLNIFGAALYCLNVYRNRR